MGDKRDNQEDFLNIKKSGHYDRLEVRVEINFLILREVCNQIRLKYPNSNLPDYKLGKLIGGHRNSISNALAGHSMPMKIFKNLEKMFGCEIPHKTRTPLGEEFNFEINAETAQFVTIMLGDGHLGKYEISISLNGVDEYPYVCYVKEFMERMLKKKPEEIWSRDDKDPNRLKGIKLRLYSLAAVDGLRKIGLISGDKVKLQVLIPQIFKKFPNSCLKGLMDTDGSIMINKIDRSFRISFTNGSKPLVEDFKQLCEHLEIKTSKVNSHLREDDNKYDYRVIISSKTGFKKFIEIVNPEKWKDNNRRKYWGIQLIYFDAQDIIKRSIENQIINDFPKKRDRTFSIKYLDYLEKLCKKYGLNINDDNIENHISRAMEYVKNQYSSKLAKTLKNLFIETGSYVLVKENFKGLSIDPKTIKHYIKRLFEEEFHGISFLVWYDHNNSMVINENGKFNVFGFKFHRMICRRIYKILANENFLDLDEEAIFLKLKFTIDNECFPNNNQILKYERLSFLLNNPIYKNYIKFYFVQHIKFVKSIVSIKKRNLRIIKRSLSDNFKALGNKDTLLKLILDLERTFKTNFDIFYSKEQTFLNNFSKNRKE